MADGIDSDVWTLLLLLASVVLLIGLAKFIRSSRAASKRRPVAQEESAQRSSDAPARSKAPLTQVRPGEFDPWTSDNRQHLRALLVDLAGWKGPEAWARHHVPSARLEVGWSGTHGEQMDDLLDHLHRSGQVSSAWFEVLVASTPERLEEIEAVRKRFWVG